MKYEMKKLAEPRLGFTLATHEYGPFLICWTGWLPAVKEKTSDDEVDAFDPRYLQPTWDDSRSCTGQWHAAIISRDGRPMGDFCWYASYPGGEGAYQRGTRVDVEPRAGQHFVVRENLTTSALYDVYKQQTLDRLLRVLDGVELPVEEKAS